MSSIRKTITSIFMVPTLKIPKNALANNGFINGFVKDEMRDVQYENAIYLLFRPSQIDSFREFLDNEYERTKSIIDDYDYPNGFVVVVYKLNPEFLPDFDVIRSGKYAKTSPTFQKEFSKFVRIEKHGKATDELSLQYRIFNRTEDMIKFWEDKFDVTFEDDWEVWHGFEEEKETLNEETLKEYTDNES